MEEKIISFKKFFAYLGIVAVIFIWGLSPIFTSELLTHYSASMYTVGQALISGIALLVICFPKLKKLDVGYLKVAIPTGLFYALANLFQKIGLQYTTTTQYAFLENLSCVIVPILLWIFIKKKPRLLTVLASSMCLIGCFVLSGISFSGNGISFGKGEFLCALAGIFYGVNIAGTGAFAKELDAALYVMIQTWVNAIVGFIAALALHFVKLDGQPIETIVFSFKPQNLLALGVLALVSSTLCWIIRTNAMKSISPSVVAVMMPFSSVITGISSVIIGKDVLSAKLITGGIIVFSACILSGLEDVEKKPKKSRTENASKQTEK